MILEYHRPGTSEEALRLISRKSPRTVVIGGGTDLDVEALNEDIAVVDLQNLAFHGISLVGNHIEIGAYAKLQSLVDHDLIQDEIKNALRNEFGLNKRYAATLGGTIIASDGRSCFTTALVALDALLEWLPGSERIPVSHFLTLRHEWKPEVMLKSIEIPGTVTLKCAVAARTPADLPIVCVAVCMWPSGRTRIALGGYGPYPILVFDGPEPTGSDLAAASAFRNAGDEWASAEYRSDVSSRLVRRLVSEMRRRP